MASQGASESDASTSDKFPQTNSTVPIENASITHNTEPPSLPQELVDIIVDFCFPNFKTLLAASLVSRAFSQSCRYRLFPILTLTGFELECDERLFTLLQSPHCTLVRCVREVKVKHNMRWAPSGNDWSRAEQVLPYAFPNLISLSIIFTSNVRFESKSIPLDILRFVCSFRHLETLSIVTDGTLRLRLPSESGVHNKLPESLSSLTILSARDDPEWIYPLFQWLPVGHPTTNPSAAPFQELVLSAFTYDLAPYLKYHCAALQRLCLVLGPNLLNREGTPFSLSNLPSLQALVLSASGTPASRSRLSLFARLLRTLGPSPHLHTIGFDICPGDMTNRDLDSVLPALDAFFARPGANNDNGNNDASDDCPRSGSSVTTFPNLRNVGVSVLWPLPPKQIYAGDDFYDEVPEYPFSPGDLVENAKRNMVHCRENGWLSIQHITLDREGYFMHPIYHNIKYYCDTIVGRFWE